MVKVKENTGHFFALAIVLTVGAGFLIATESHEAVRCDMHVALTFDDGPNHKTTNSLVHTLKQYKATGTFFFTGEKATEDPGTVRTMRKQGMQVGNHSFSHKDLTTLNSKEVYQEFLGTNQILIKTDGRPPRFFRPPYDNINANVVVQARKLGLFPALWTVDSKDYSGASVDEIVKNATNVKNGDVVLLHDGVENTSKALPEIMKDYRQRNIRTSNLANLQD